MFKDVFGNMIELGDRVIHRSPYGTYEGFVESFTKQKVRIVHLDSFYYLPEDQYDRQTGTIHFDKIPDLAKYVQKMRQPVNASTLVCIDKQINSKTWKDFPEIKTRLGL